MAGRSSRATSSRAGKQQAAAKVASGDKHPLVTCRISVFWEGENKYFRGKITREVRDHSRNVQLFHVEYDDGEAHDENLKDDKFRWHGPRASRSTEPYHSRMRPAMLDLGAENAKAEDSKPAATLPNGKVPEPIGGVPQQSEAVGWRIRFWWVGTCEWVDGEVLSYRASDARHLVLFADGEFEWMSISHETIWWLANTRERGNRLTPLAYGLDGAAIPKGRDAIEWRVDIYDRNQNEFLRSEITEFDTVTGKHKVEYMNGHKPLWLSLTASKIIWRFPPGLPAPASEPVTPREEPDAMPAAPSESPAPAAPPAAPQGRGRKGRKRSQAVAAVEVSVPEGTALQPKTKSRRTSAPSSPKAKHSKGKSSGDAVFVRADSTVAIATEDRSQQRPQEKQQVPAEPSEASQPPASAPSAPAPQPAPAVPSEEKPEREPVATKKWTVPVKPLLRPTVPASTTACAEVGSGGKGPVPAVHNPPVPPVPTAAPRQTVTHVAPDLRPAVIRRSSMKGPITSDVLRPVAFTKAAVLSPASLVKPASVFGDVHTLLEATQKRQQFLREVMQLLDTGQPGPAASVPNLQPTPSGVPSPARTPVIPTDPRRVVKPSSAPDTLRPPAPDAAVPASAPPRQNVPSPARFSKGEAAKPAMVAQKLPTASARPPTAPRPPAPSQPASGTPHPPPFTPKFAPLPGIVHSVRLASGGAAVPGIAAVSSTQKVPPPMFSGGQGSPVVQGPAVRPVGATLPKLSVLQQGCRQVPKHVQSSQEGPVAPPDQNSSSSGQAAEAGTAPGDKHSGTESSSCSGHQKPSKGGENGAEKNGTGQQGKGNCQVDVENGKLENGKLRQPVNGSSQFTTTAKLGRDSSLMINQEQDSDSHNRTSSNMKCTTPLRWTGMPFGRPALGVGGGPAASSAGGRACG